MIQSTNTIIRKEFLVKLSLIIGSLLLLAAAGEIWLRLFSDNDMMKLYRLYPQGVLCEPDSLFGWIGKSEGSGVLAFEEEDTDDMHIQMNAEGFWDIEHKQLKPKGNKRILTIGDSFTIGYGLSKNKRFTELIKKSLPSFYEVINMGMWGYSTGQELLVLKERGLKYSPDIIILSMFIDDIFCSNLYSVNDGLYIKPKFKVRKDNSLELDNVPIPDNHGRSFLLNMILSRFFKLCNRMEMGSEFNKKGWISVFDKKYLKQNKYSLFLRLLNEIYHVSKSNNAEFLLVIIPYKSQVFELRGVKTNLSSSIPAERLDLMLPQKVITLFCKKTGIQVVDLLPVFVKHPHPEALYFHKDLHWTKDGNTVAAENILSFLISLGYL